ncbi:MAG: chemotaxis response regulator protein-glutamate methylesterase [Alphaproteobacteria bacterium]|nr:MAG: chemotaxis response regulator protein-glutamate methylesterase [Alphaproteobacteria bacterium]
MVVDDSAVIRGFLTRYLQADGSIKVVSTAANGIMALRNLAGADVEVVVLDIEMPEMDGMTALPKILEAEPDVQVVMASTLTRKNAEISLRALKLGAVDYVPKPESNREVNANIDFQRELVEKVKIYAAARRRAKGVPLPEGERAPGVQPKPVSRRVSYTTTARRQPAAPARHSTPSSPYGAKPIVLRQPSMLAPEILAIGSSTGGPQALLSLLTKLAPRIKNIPVLIVQHMPATFTAILADHLGRATGLPASEPEDGEVVRAGHIYVARGGYHMRVERDGGVTRIRLDQGPEENFCRPAVDPLFRSVAETYGGKALAVVLTGMGHDGLRGARDLVGAGGTLIAQDEASSVVWGMPGAVATAGLCAAVVPLHAMDDHIAKALGARP